MCETPWCCNFSETQLLFIGHMQQSKMIDPVYAVFKMCTIPTTKQNLEIMMEVGNVAKNKLHTWAWMLYTPSHLRYF